MSFIKTSMYLGFIFNVFFPLKVPVIVGGDLKGNVKVTRSVEFDTKIMSQHLIHRYTSQGEKDNSHQPKEQYPEIVIYIEGVDNKNFTVKNGQTAVLDQKDERFVPHVLPILVGTTVQFPNSDNVYHNVFSFSEPKSFDLGRYKKGRSKKVTFNKPGLVKVYCDIHTHMNAFIMVLENPYFAKTDKKGDYEIKNIPNGKYILKAWHGRWLEKSQEITITDSTTIVNFEFP